MLTAQELKTIVQNRNKDEVEKIIKSLPSKIDKECYAKALSGSTYATLQVLPLDKEMASLLFKEMVDNVLQNYVNNQYMIVVHQDTKNYYNKTAFDIIFSWGEDPLGYITGKSEKILYHTGNITDDGMTYYSS